MKISRGARFAAACAPVLGLFVFALPAAHADPLPNGYDTTCTKSNDTQVVCVTTGCPRVKGDEAGDVIHTKVSGGPQSELSLPCNSTTSQTISTSASFDYGVQGCRKHPIGSDDCGAWANYHYEAPATPGPAVDPNKAANDQAAADKAANDQAAADKAAADKAAADKAAADKAAADAKAAEPVTDAITATFNPGLGSIAVNVSNNSDLNGKCTMNWSPFGKAQNFNVPAHGSFPTTVGGINLGITYQFTVNCTDASGKQNGPIGSVQQSVTF